MADYRNLVNYVEALIPEMKKKWAEVYKLGWEMRMAGKPFKHHGRKHKGSAYLGWKNADKYLRGEPLEERGWMPDLIKE